MPTSVRKYIIKNDFFDRLKRYTQVYRFDFYILAHISSQMRFENSTGFSMFIPSIRRA